MGCVWTHTDKVQTFDWAISAFFFLSFFGWFKNLFGTEKFVIISRWLAKSSSGSLMAAQIRSKKTQQPQRQHLAKAQRWIGRVRCWLMDDVFIQMASFSHPEKNKKQWMYREIDQWPSGLRLGWVSDKNEKRKTTAGRKQRCPVAAASRWSVDLQIFLAPLRKRETTLRRFHFPPSTVLVVLIRTKDTVWNVPVVILKAGSHLVAHAASDKTERNFIVSSNPILRVQPSVLFCVTTEHYAQRNPDTVTVNCHLWRPGR